MRFGGVLCTMTRRERLRMAMPAAICPGNDLFALIKNYLDRASHNAPHAAISHEDLRGLDIEFAIVAHESWRRRLLAYLDGNSSEIFPVTEVCKDDACELGHWIHGRGKDRLGQHPAFTMLMGHHKWLHHAAAELVMLAQATAQTPDTADTRQRRISQFERFSRAVKQDLESLRLVS